MCDVIAAGARAVVTLGPTLTGLEQCPEERADCAAAVARGHFTPAEDERLRTWFARYLTARAALREVIGDLTPLALEEERASDEATRMRAFVVGYAAACLLVRAGRFLVATFATDGLVHRKLNEAEPRFRIPRKQYTAIYHSLTDPMHAWRLREAMQLADSRRDQIDALASDEVLGPVVGLLRLSEEALRVGVRAYLKARLRYRWHSLRRRRASAVQQVIFALAEVSGRVIADVGNPWHRRRVTPEICQRLETLLEPGDVIITRRDDAFSNLFLPGYWPHSALYVGPEETRERLKVEVDPQRLPLWAEPMRVLEARKDGVRFRALADTLTVDAVAVLRPELDPGDIGRALAQAITHEGKLYNFDFDFFRADRLVCTEVIYRAYDGIGPTFTLRQRGGRPTLSAEDLLDMALEGRGFGLVAVYGALPRPADLVTGPEAGAVICAIRNRDAGGG